MDLFPYPSSMATVIATKMVMVLHLSMPSVSTLTHSSCVARSHSWTYLLNAYSDGG